MRNRADSKWSSSDGNPTMAGWGWWVNHANVLKPCVMAVSISLSWLMFKREDDDGRVIKRPMVATRLRGAGQSGDVVIVGYMTTINDKGLASTKRLIIVDPASDKYVARPHRSARTTLGARLYKDRRWRSGDAGTRGLRQRQYWQVEGKSKAAAKPSHSKLTRRNDRRSSW